MRSKLDKYTLYYVYLAIAIFVVIYVSTVEFYYSGKRIIRALRNAYLKAILRQNMAYFDTHSPGEISTRIMSDMNLVQEGITSKASIALTAFATFATAFVINFIMYWKTALVLSPTFVAMVVIGSFGGAYVVKQHKIVMAQSSQASSLAEEAIASMRLVSAFGIQEHIAGKYSSCLTSARRPGIRSQNAIAGMIACSNAVPSLVYALTFWASSIFFVRGEVSVAALTTTALVVVIGAFVIVRIDPAAQALSSTVSSAEISLEEIARRSTQDPFASSGDCSATVKGDVEFRGVSLIYPSRDNRIVLHKVSFACPAMKITAILGVSGSGKSSIVALIERFYESTAGKVCLDRKDIQSLNLSWLRGQMALVGQEPRLFDATIFENIRYGELSRREKAIQESPEEIRERVISAARKANADDFITALPEGYQTQVGQKGFQLAGGQRQRISIARALIRNLSILLLDEAISALDSKSEATVQVAIEEAARQHTTIIIAHRLSTIRHSDNIIVMSEGRVAEQGTHDDIVARDGHYPSLVRAQQIYSGSSEGKLASSNDSHEGIEEAEAHSHGKDALVQDLNEKQPPDVSNFEKKIESLGLTRTLAFNVKHNSKEYPLLILGLCCSIIAGLAIPGQSVIFAKVLETLSLHSLRYHQLRNDIDLYAGLFLMVAGVAFLSWLGAGVAFAYSTEKLSHRLRDRCFISIMSQDVASSLFKPCDLTRLLLYTLRTRNILFCLTQI
ncbi:P-loop containing nucleoside triphosphate hydrolase protein [Pseudomassariella vexata]|uniref:p-loop containing nucleoside triphosphate hydrolase protein n=1 Tax=Pseudomassariella vexata TaxID=1141098 RepID=A0A1Y2DKY2_9PEZI|nr:P-loop containing nucleoside triphosphate hydrolase protein [Pseudomassariella vexata]ORY59940.1 P-loop containing nucleoside triphosphate hydrolase protein [Pseudomassariella vexata]